MSWLLHPDFKDFFRTQTHWNSQLEFGEAVSDITTSLNKTVFGIISHKKKRLFNKLRGIKTILEKGDVPYLRRLQSSLQSDLELILR